MKSEPKAFASLSSGLLARKGAARPAMRPQGFGQSGAGLEDLGWNDMGFEAPKAAASPLRDASHDAFGEEIAAMPSRNPLAGLTPVESPVHTQQAEIADRFAAGADEENEDELDETAEIFEPETDEPVEVVALESVAADCVVETEITADASAAPIIVAVPTVPEPQPVVAFPRRTARTRSAPGSKGKAAFTLRLDPSRHLKLRLACAVGGRSAQQLVTDALDELLAAMPELDAMAARANRKG